MTASEIIQRIESQRNEQQRQVLMGTRCAYAEKHLHHPHDLMHKAVGWMLREMGKRDIIVLRQFLERHAHEMPRTALRYAIEKMPKSERKEWMKTE